MVKSAHVTGEVKPVLVGDTGDSERAPVILEEATWRVT